uniref:Uncharacterized protein n=1 Tax=Molossus molossus TaxID=27622 RepID=A0A7J8I7J0_MOLMO|nr:hypothetical protein HJG59_010495 [Molossus molossus]
MESALRDRRPLHPDMGTAQTPHPTAACPCPATARSEDEGTRSDSIHTTPRGTLTPPRTHACAVGGQRGLMAAGGKSQLLRECVEAPCHVAWTPGGLTPVTQEQGKAVPRASPPWLPGPGAHHAVSGASDGDAAVAVTCVAGRPRAGACRWQFLIFLSAQRASGFVG